MNMRIAFGTDDGENLAKKHFGESRYFKIYELIDSEKIVFLETRENISGKEKGHGDPEKAKKISNILKDIDILVGYTFGPNLKRIKKKFLPIVSRYERIDENIELIKQYLKTFIEELKRKDKRIFLINPGPELRIIGAK
ncbi:MAG TPA: dinitrogenase iron-molybdenum cofactor biosynthesis protein [Thermoprotei archaeon]|nr:dinitrogenase iron-molybdenum cofactor biosynthesis protein [Thermoprotei archaeon]